MRYSLPMVMVALLALGAAPAASAVTDFHPQGAECGSCHLAGSKVTPENAHQLVASQETLCGKCHKNALTMSHPSGFAPKHKPPGEYPVDWKGDITCSTCHEIHHGGPGKIRGAKRGRDFCLACHDEAFFAKMADDGTSIQISGHLDARAGSVSVLLDPFSIQCLGCHDSEGNGDPVEINARGIVRHGGGGINHPIGMAYDTATQSGPYHPSWRLPPQIVLPDGKVGCVSCHVGYSKKHGALVMSNAGSRLCLECHDL